MSLLDKASLIVTPNAYKASKLYSVIPSDGTGDMTVVRATTATRVNSSSLIEIVAINIPRIDYTKGSCPSLLVEPQRTNLALYSEQFNNASWTTNGVNVSITANAIISPDGTSNADNILANSTLDIHNIQQRTGSATSGTTYTMSVYVKKLGYDYCSIQTSNTGTSVGTFRFSTKTLTISGSDVVANSGRVDELANGWFRISLSVLAPASATWRWTINVLNDSGTASFIGDGTKGLSVFGFQMEAGSYPTSYIPTVASSVTRNADVISKTGISSLIGQTEGTIFLDVKALANDNTTRQISISDNSFNNYVRFNFTAATNFGNAALISTGTTQATNDFTLNQTNKNKIAIKYNTNLFEIYLNGVLIHQDLSVNTFSGTTLSSLQFSNPLGGNIWYGNLNSLQFYKTALTNAECITLTTL